MSGSAGTGPPPAFPVVIYNPPGLSAISYRVGDYTTFREALLQNLPGESELNGWRPSADGDLALQLLEWWAYVADVLTFYNERIANNSYLGTAVLPTVPAAATAAPAAPESSATPGLPDTTALIAGVTGYRPRPGIAAVGQLAVLVNGKTAVSVPAGFAVQSKPGPGQQAQVFEAVLSANTYTPSDLGGAVPVDLAYPTFFTTGGVTISAAAGAKPKQPGPLLKGTVTSIKAGDLVVVAQGSPPYLNATTTASIVTTVGSETDPRGRTNTRLTFASFTPPAGFTPSAATLQPDVTGFQVLRSIQWASPYVFDNQTGDALAVTGLTPSMKPVGIHLASLVRDIAVGDLVVLEIDTPASASPVSYVSAQVIGYQETIWFANADDPATAPQTPPAASQHNPPKAVAIPIPHSFLTLESVALGSFDSSQQTVNRVWYGYRAVSAVLDEIPTPSIPAASDIVNLLVQPAGAVNNGVPAGATVLLEGADGIGATATLVAPIVSGAAIQLRSSDATSLLLPIRLLFNVINVTAGKTVSNEVLGNGDATVPSQSFPLQKSPLTYLKGTDPNTPVSTLQVQVDNVAWTEVANFQDQPADAKVFVTQQDKTQNTTVTFGDGVKGARLTTGTGNVTATYRYGSGPGDPTLGGPAPTTLVTILTPVPGLGSVRNPVAMTGGAAPSTPAQIQQSAPSQALTMGLAVSPADYEAIVAQSPSVTRSRAGMGWDNQRHSNVVTVYVGGGANAVSAAQAALGSATDPNRPVVVAQASAIVLQAGLNVTYAAGFDPATIRGAVTAALSDPVAGVLAPSQIRIGDPLYNSQIYGACLKVAGVLAVRRLSIRDITAGVPGELLTGTAHSPGAGGYFSLAAEDVIITLEPGNG